MIYAELLQAANFDAWESVQRALDKMPDDPPERAQWLEQHILATKLEYAALITQALSWPSPPENLSRDLSALMTWEVEEVAALTPDNLEVELQYGQRKMTIGEVVSLNIRHSVWHAGQLAAVLAS